MKRIDHDKYKLGDDHRRFKEFQRANSNWGKKVATTSTGTPTRKNSPIPAAGAVDQNQNQCQGQSGSISGTSPKQWKSAAAKPTWSYGTRTFSKPSEMKSTANSPSTLSSRPSGIQNGEEIKPKVRAGSITPRPVRRPGKVGGAQSPAPTSAEEKNLSVESQQNQSENSESLENLNQSESNYEMDSTDASLTFINPSYLDGETSEGASSAASANGLVVGVNVPDLPVDKPTMDPRLQVPNKIEFVKEGNGPKKGKFAIKNVSNVHMTYKVYTTNALVLYTNSDVGILEPNEEISFDLECESKLFREKIAVFGFPIYFSRQLNKDAVNLLWKVFRTAHFPEKYAEEHNLILVPGGRWSKLNDYKIFRRFSSMRLFGEEEKSLDWIGNSGSDLDLDKFKSTWTMDNYAMMLIQYNNEEMNWSRHLEMVKDGEKMREDRQMNHICIFFVLLFIFIYALLKYCKPELFERDLIDTSGTKDYREESSGLWSWLGY